MTLCTYYVEHGIDNLFTVVVSWYVCTCITPNRFMDKTKLSTVLNQHEIDAYYIVLPASFGRHPKLTPFPPTDETVKAIVDFPCI